jgi:hypothetical protein
LRHRVQGVSKLELREPKNNRRRSQRLGGKVGEIPRKSWGNHITKVGEILEKLRAELETKGT